MKRSLVKLKKIEKMEVDGTFANMTKKRFRGCRRSRPGWSAIWAVSRR